MRMLICIGGICGEKFIIKSLVKAPFAYLWEKTIPYPTVKLHFVTGG